MKHFLKPLGHCLTTAVMTSAMLRVYALPPVEAATPDVDPQLASNTASEGSATLAAPNLSVSAPIAQPEVIDAVESAPVLEPPAPIIPAAADIASVQQGGNAPVEQPIGDPAATDSVSDPAKAEAAPAESLPKPDAVPQNTVQPEADAGSGLDTEAESDAKQTPTPATQKADTSSSRTVAGMRQIIEKRLETIVGQDKESRDAKWQQNLIQVALEYAWLGKFDAAREVAANSALPLELQISLLGKIAAIETEFLASQVAQLPNPTGNQPQANRISQTATPQGRNIPSSYSTVNGVAASGYAGFDNQCPVVESPSKVIAPPQTSPRPTAAPKATSGVPDFVPALGQNLASRLADLSQTQRAPAPTTAKPMVPPPQLVSPQLFVGVATSSVQAQSGSLSSVPKASQPKVNQPKNSQPQVNPLKASQPKLSQPQIEYRVEYQVAERLLPSPLPSQPQTSAPQSLAAAKNSTVRQMVRQTEAKRVVQPQATLPERDSFQSFIAFPELFDNPLDWVWNWWNVPSSQEAEPFSDSATARSTNGSLLSVAEMGLTNKLLFQTIEQDLSTALQPLRNARKLSLSLPSTKPVSLKAPLKTPAYDPSALLSISCRQAQLGQSRWSNALINPATAKQFGWVNFMFPLPIPAVITSAFGWRTHPISGDLRFHTGLDLGAPMGTPVLAATKGRVVVADAMGGYGLAVVVEDETTHQRNLYAHLSGIAVQPGATVEQGMVVGWVGSTGNSTGPHLHFESQVKTENGWTVIDPLASAAVVVAQGR